MPECNNCGSHLSSQYVKVFSTKEDSIDHCVHCVGKTVDPNTGEPRSRQTSSGGGAVGTKGGVRRGT